MKRTKKTLAISGAAASAVLVVAALACARVPEGNAASKTTKAPDAGKTPAAMAAKPAKEDSIPKLNKPLPEWKKLLSPEAYHVLFEQGTEMAFTSLLYEEHRKGTFICAACYLPLFRSETKYASGTGWPSFWAPIEGHVALEPDNSIAELRTEYHCVRCGGHQGHVFDDGPKPTGQRWCNDGVSLLFVPDGKPLPELRK